MAVDADILRPSSDPAIRKETQNQDMARTICSMVAFGCNRRNNGMQLTNGLLFIACGVTERVNKYLNYVGLSCSRKTAHIGLATLGKEFEKKLRDLFGNDDSKVFSPSICIDNLDFQQSIHTNLLSSLALSSIIRKEVADLHRNMQCQVAETFDFSFLVFIQPRPSFTLNS
ncbi:hypothetical protein PGTUg99_020996 [Puccinia graminis f. sp. tritici]|uniref:Uncharacterized protein n=1 Tax=Puccinia graminis f. sp. tritici TaxID=56615 RepID=A0A5B0QU43_PUCGR|nr:hypothetical protein PGTUg99_020996 [Puccinia graminis f. sp. tritici]